MNVSKQFINDFAYLANLYGWAAGDIEDVKAQTRANPEPMRRYWTTLASAHRAGYEQTAANGHMRLGDWLERCGRPPLHATSSTAEAPSSSAAP
jgi:hypothetical protein